VTLSPDLDLKWIQVLIFGDLDYVTEKDLNASLLAANAMWQYLHVIFKPETEKYTTCYLIHLDVLSPQTQVYSTY